MGSLASRPKIPEPEPQVVYIPASMPAYNYTPAYTPPPQTATPAEQGASGTPTAPPPASAEERAAASRTASLLERSRGRYGTIQTSFRGLLSAASGGVQKKTLLGE